MKYQVGKIENVNNKYVDLFLQIENQNQVIADLVKQVQELKLTVDILSNKDEINSKLLKNCVDRLSWKKRFFK